MANNPIPGPKDKRSKLDLELFLLALIKRDINTPYLLHTSAALSPGATIPVLNRLETSGYVQRGVSGPRRRAEYRITAEGTRYLSKSWRPLLAAPPPPEIESVFRIVGLALMSGADLNVVSAFLTRAAGRKALDAMNHQSTAARRELLDSESWEADFYACLQAMHAASRLSAESKFLRGLAQALLKGDD